MASVVIGGIGAAIGGAVGGPAGAQLGFSIGTLIGGALFPPKQAAQERGRLDDVRMTGSQYGAMIPIIHGCGRVGANLIEVSDLREVVTKKKSGGKGARKPTVKNYTYFVDLAGMVCEGRVGQIKRIWGEDIKIYDAGSVPALTPSNITVYTGTPTQPVDPTLQTLHAAGATPAYRNRCYFVIDEFDLTPWGGRIPVLNVEVCPLPGLVLQSIADGATAVYQFNETTGDLIDVTVNAHDHAVDATVTRAVAAPDPEDLLGYRFSSATDGSSPFGHTQGTRPSWANSQAWTMEAIVRRVGALPGASRWLLHAERAGGSTAAELTVNSSGDLRAGIQVTGQSFNSQSIALQSSGESASFAHYVWQWDGTTHRGWRNGVQKYAVTVGPGGTGLADSSAFNMAFGGVFGAGTLNADCEIDFVAIYPSTHLTATQIATHYAVSGVA